MNIGIIGTRGIPNNYGGFEQFAQYLSLALVEKGHSVIVYNSHNHPFKESNWRGIELKHCYDPEKLIGTAGQFVYDLNCILDARQRNFDVILQLGYTSSSIWSFLFPRKSVIVTNMDGLEWKRTKYSDPVKKFLKYAESIAAKKSSFLVADSPAIQKYLLETYNKHSTFIPYGANQFTELDATLLSPFGVEQFNYDLIIARMEPENNIEVILDGINTAESKRPCIVVGNASNTFGSHLVRKFAGNKLIKFVGSIYDIHKLNNLRYFSNIYFHGHSVGGTNPSLLEAMASHTLIVAHQNGFNEAVLGDDAYYFTSSDDISHLVLTLRKVEHEKRKIDNNLQKIEQHYNWEKIVLQYEELFIRALS